MPVLGGQFKPVLGGQFTWIFHSIEQISNILAKKDHVKIKPSGQNALNKVGLSTKKLSMKGEITSLLFLGLEELDLKNISSTQLKHIQMLIKKDTSENLKYNLRLAPAKVSDFIIKNILNPV